MSAPILPGLPGGPPWPPEEPPAGVTPTEAFARFRRATDPLRLALEVDDPWERDYTPRPSPSAYAGEDPDDEDACPSCGAPGPPAWPTPNMMACRECGYEENVGRRLRRAEP